MAYFLGGAPIFVFFSEKCAAVEMWESRVLCEISTISIEMAFN